jgi:hypothetical protein
MVASRKLSRETRVNAKAKGAVLLEVHLNDLPQSKKFLAAEDGAGGRA